MKMLPVAGMVRAEVCEEVEAVESLVKPGNYYRTLRNTPVPILLINEREGQGRLKRLRKT